MKNFSMKVMVSGLIVLIIPILSLQSILHGDTHLSDNDDCLGGVRCSHYSALGEDSDQKGDDCLGGVRCSHYSALKDSHQRIEKEQRDVINDKGGV